MLRERNPIRRPCQVTSGKWILIRGILIREIQRHIKSLRLEESRGLRSNDLEYLVSCVSRGNSKASALYYNSTFLPRRDRFTIISSTSYLHPTTCLQMVSLMEMILFNAIEYSYCAYYNVIFLVQFCILR